jgi:hypothetical protein
MHATDLSPRPLLSGGLPIVAEHMFSSTIQRLAPRVFERLGLIVEFSTLGEYGMDRDGFYRPAPHVGPPSPDERSPIGDRARPRDHCPHRGRLSRSCGGAPARS